jgi:hypothetical protein
MTLLGIEIWEGFSFRRASQVTGLNKPIPSPHAEDFDFSVLMSWADHYVLAIRPVFDNFWPPVERLHEANLSSALWRDLATRICEKEGTEIRHIHSSPSK